jgi:hypothetical protein
MATKAGRDCVGSEDGLLIPRNFTSPHSPEHTVIVHDQVLVNIRGGVAADKG